MKTIETTIGYREEYPNGEIRYYPDYEGEGFCYKDIAAFDKRQGICYIREAIFSMIHDQEGREYVTNKDLEKSADNCTRAQMEEFTREFFADAYDVNKEAPGYNAFIDNTTTVIFYEIEWQGFDMLLNEWDWTEDMKHFGCLNDPESNTEEHQDNGPSFKALDVILNEYFGCNIPYNEYGEPTEEGTVAVEKLIQLVTDLEMLGCLPLNAASFCQRQIYDIINNDLLNS